MNSRRITHLTGKLGIVAVGLVSTLTAALSGCGKTASTAGTEGQGRPLVAVTAVVVKKTNVPLVINRSGTTRSLSQMTVRARVRGFLTEKLFKEGGNVKAGDLLLVIDEKPFQVKVDLSKAMLAEAEATLKQAEQSKAKEIAAAQVKLAETQYSLDEVEERRERSLYVRKASSVEDLDRAVAKKNKSAASVDSEKASREQKVSDYDTGILSARAKVDQAKADLSNAEIDLGYCRMSALIGGRIGELKVKPGNLVGSTTAGDDSLVTIEQLNPMGVDLNPAARYLPIVTRLVKTGLSITVTVPRDGGPGKFQGKIIFIDNKVDPTTSTFLLRAEVRNSDETLLPGEFVNVTMDLGEYVDVFLVPERSVIERQEGTIVLVADDQGKVSVKPVEVLDDYQGFRIVQSGLEPGQRVIAEGVQLARPGETVNVEVAELEKYRRVEDATGSKNRFNNGKIRYKGEETAPAPTPAPAEAPGPTAVPPPKS